MLGRYHPKKERKMGKKKKNILKEKWGGKKKPYFEAKTERKKKNDILKEKRGGEKNYA